MSTVVARLEAPTELGVHLSLCYVEVGRLRSNVVTSFDDTG